jgi:hypothetical protein
MDLLGKNWFYTKFEQFITLDDNNLIVIEITG